MKEVLGQRSEGGSTFSHGKNHLNRISHVALEIMD